jgi:hypothetical protein
VIGKHDGTGGLVSVGTVTSQLLYEIGGAQYLGPDVTSRFDTISLEQVEPDRVLISGVKGEPPTGSLKVAMNELGGYRNDMVLALTGLDVEEKSEMALEAFWEASPYAAVDFEECEVRLVRTDHSDPESNEAATAQLRISVKDRDERKVGRAFSNAFVEIGLSSIPGFYSLSGGPSAGSPFGVYRPALVPADLVPAYVHVNSSTRQVESVAPEHSRVSVEPTPGPQGSPSTGETRSAPLGTLFGARSGDKGGDANLGMFARSDEAWLWLDEFLTVERFKDLLPETANLTVDRYAFANIRSLNFVVRGLLSEGVAASTRTDGQAKSLGEWLRARFVDIPVDLLD